MPKKFDQEAKDRVVRLVEDRILAENLSMQQACQAVAPKLGVSWHTARQWTQQARRDGLTHQHQPEDLVAEVAKLRRENRELRDTNELLKAASAFFASELDPKRRK
ncbi:MAG: transposase [Yaniella sp.]|nr:transposase [Yaniella sp.]